MDADHSDDDKTEGSIMAQTITATQGWVAWGNVEGAVFPARQTAPEEADSKQSSRTQVQVSIGESKEATHNLPLGDMASVDNTARMYIGSQHVFLSEARLQKGPELEVEAAETSICMQRVCNGQ